MSRTTKVQIHCLNTNQTKEYERGTSLAEILADQMPEDAGKMLIAQENNVTKNLNFCVYKPKEVQFLSLDHPSAQRAYRRSLTFLLHRAVREVMPGYTLRVEYEIADGSYCFAVGADGGIYTPTEAQLRAIAQCLEKEVSEDMPFEMETVPAQKALEIFGKQGQQSTVNLLETMGKLFYDIYWLGDLADYYDSALVPSTGYLRTYDLLPYHKGMVLRMPKKSDEKMKDFWDQPKLFEAFAEHARWNKIMGIANAGDLNKIVKNDRPKIGADNGGGLITIAETLQEKKIDHIADLVVADPRVHVVLIAGPSSSGKTTFSKKLSVHLAVNGKKPIPFSMDDYFVNREDTPKDENGEYDFESVHAIDIPQFNTDLKKMLAGEEVELPHYNFGTGKREYRGEKIRLDQNTILVIEGIHGLNPELTAQVPEENKFRIYASALTTISIDDHNYIPTTDNRLLRRIVRDYNYRGYSAEDTINRWASVHRGEEKWIYPFRERANIMFNSALIFEFQVLKKFAEPILRQVPQTSKAYSEAVRLLKFLDYFSPISENDIPGTSLLREFFGGSFFAD